MAGSPLHPATSKELQKLLALLASSAGETLASLVNRSVTLRPRESRLVDHDTLVAALNRACVVARGSLDKAYAGRSMVLMFEIQDAIAMAGMLMMTPDEVIEQHRASGVIGGEDAEAFGELGNVLFSGIGTTLRANIDDIDIRLQSHGVVKPGVDVDRLVDDVALVALAFGIQVGGYPETTGYMVVDLATAERWNGSPVESFDAAAEAPSAAAESRPAAGVRSDDQAYEAIPAAPVRGTMAAFVSLPEVLHTLRHSCRRVGLELRRHGKGEIPNPAAHRDQIVVVDVPPGEERQFDWCKRIKDFAPDNKVVLLLHHPSRNRVMLAFHTKADVILGFPCDELQLSHKLAAMLEPSPSPDG
jgi:hypothetical protein